MQAVTHHHLADVLQTADWCARLRGLALDARSSVDDAALLRRIGRSIREAIHRNHAGLALRWAFAGLALSRNRSHQIADALRPSAVVEGGLRKVSWIVRELRDLLKRYPELQHHVSSLESWIAFTELVTLARSAKSKLEYSVAKTPHGSVHCVLSIVDEAFHSERPPRLLTTAPIAFEELNEEQGAAGASYIIEAMARMRKLTGTKRESSRPTTQASRDVIVTAWWLQELLEYEVLVYRMGFRCIAEGCDTFRIEAPTDSVGYGLSYGYFQNNYLPALRIHDDVYETVRLEALSEAFVAATKDARPYVLIRDTQRSHFGYRIREEHAQAIASVVNRKTAFREEEMELRIACAQLRLDTEDLLQLELAPGLPIRDVVRFQRLLRFLALTRSAELDASDLTQDERLDARLLFLNRESFLQLVSALGLERVAAERLVETFSWNAASETHLDIQHTPIISLEDHLLIPLSVASHSNLIRNGLWSSRIRPYADGTVDPLVSDLRLAFEMAGFPVWANVKYEWDGRNYEIDVLALVGSHLVVIEAKNTLFPCSYFELRTTWDCLEKAGKQLDRHAAALSDVDVRARVSKRLGVDINNVKCVTCIVVNHPLLSGIDMFGHPVRQCDVVCSFVALGDATAWIGNRRTTTRLRPEGPLLETDLLHFLSDNSPAYQDVWAAGLKRPRSTTLGRATLRVVEYAFNPVVQLVRSRLCSGEAQQRLEASVARLEQLGENASDADIRAAWDEANAAYEAAFQALEAAVDRPRR